MNIKSLKIIFSLSILVTLMGCASQAAKPAENSGYLAGAEMLIENRARFPFNRVWVNEEFMQDYKDYQKIYIAPVNTDYLSQSEWFKNLSEKGMHSLQGSADLLAKYMQTRFIKELERSEIDKLEVIHDESFIDDETAILELAIVELIPSPAQVNRFTSVAGFFVPFLGTATSLVVDDGSIAIEARLTDNASKETLLMFADREKDNSALLVDLNDLTYFKHSEKHIDQWAQQYVQLLQTMDDEMISDKGFKLKPW